VSPCRAVTLDTTPEVSVIMPNYNNERFISAAIESVLGQTYTDFELIVVDDASTDNSVKIAQEYLKIHPNVNILQLNQRGSSSIARNLGLESARGREICFVDSDDVYSPFKLAYQFQALEEEGRPVIVYCDWWRLDEAGNLLGPSKRVHPRKNGRIFSDAIAQAYGGVAMCMIPRACLDKIGFFDVSLPWAEDLDLLLRLAREFDFKYIDQALYGYRSHKTSKRKIIGRRERLLCEALVTERHFNAAKALVDPEAKDKVISNLVRHYYLTGQNRKMLRYGLSTWRGIGKMLSLIARERRIRE
jgi:glycosyltransferase involved in cell wall biosynthesis